MIRILGDLVQDWRYLDERIDIWRRDSDENTRHKKLEERMKGSAKLEDAAKPHGDATKATRLLLGFHNENGVLL